MDLVLFRVCLRGKKGGKVGGRGRGREGGRKEGVCCKLLEMPHVIIVLCFNTLSFHISITPNTISKVKYRK